MLFETSLCVKLCIGQDFSHAVGNFIQAALMWSLLGPLKSAEQDVYDHSQDCGIKSSARIPQKKLFCGYRKNVGNGRCSLKV